MEKAAAEAKEAKAKAKKALKVPVVCSVLGGGWVCVSSAPQLRPDIAQKGSRHKVQYCSTGVVRSAVSQPVNDDS